MKLLDLTLATAAENLALDEALLDAAEAGNADEVLRLWEPREYFAVVGYANKVDVEVDRAACERLQIPIFRRCTGGGTVLQGPGCLNYALVLMIGREPRLQTIPETNTFVMERHAKALSIILRKDVLVRGHTDLAVDDLKVSGNAQRRKRRFILFHGTFLVNFNVEQITETLRMPSKQPDYRRNRGHQQFLTNLGVDCGELKSAIASVWNASGRLATIPNYRELAELKYGQSEWNFKF